MRRRMVGLDGEWIGRAYFRAGMDGKAKSWSKMLGDRERNDGIREGWYTMTQREFFDELVKFRDKRDVTLEDEQTAIRLLRAVLDSGAMRIETAENLCGSIRFPVFWQSPSPATLWQLEQDIMAGKKVYGIC